MTTSESRRRLIKTGLVATAGLPLLAAAGQLSAATAAPTVGEQSATGGGKKEIYVCFGVDIDAVAGWIGTYGGKDSVRDITRGLFSGEVGIPRLLKLFQRWGITQIFFAPGHSIETFPEQMKQIAAAGHEIGAHGYTHENPASMTRAQEAAVLDKSIALIKNVTGSAPKGYVAPFWEFSENTINLLLERDIHYDHSMIQHDFIPYYLRANLAWNKVDYDKPAEQWMKPATQGWTTSLIEIPASWYMDDLPPMMFMDHEGTGAGYTSPQVIEQLWKDRFDWMYKEYDYAAYTLTIHPGVSGQAQNLMMLERLYEHIRGYEGVRFATMNEIATDFAKKRAAA